MPILEGADAQSADCFITLIHGRTGEAISHGMQLRALLQSDRWVTAHRMAPTFPIDMHGILRILKRSTLQPAPRRMEKRSGNGGTKVDMPRRSRLDFPGAIHYVQLCGRDGMQIFSESNTIVSDPAIHPVRHSKLEHFMSLVADVCEECNATLHGYGMEPNSGILILQRTGAPLQAIMRRLCGQYAKYLRAQHATEDGPPFKSRYASKLIAPEYLPHAVRRAHRHPVLNGLRKQRTDYPFSSERTYNGLQAMVNIETASLRRALARRNYFGQRGYQTFMDEPETTYVAGLFARGSTWDSRIVGAKPFVQEAKRRASAPDASVNSAKIIAAVALLLRTTPAEIYAPNRVGALGRSLVAWYALRHGAATVTEVARWFSVTSSTLGQSMTHHRKTHPELFDPTSDLGSDPGTDG